MFLIVEKGTILEPYDKKILAKLRSMPQTPEVKKEIQQIQDGLKRAYKAIADNNKIYFGIK